MLAGLFVLKVLAGVSYGYIYSRIPEHQIYADTWRFFYESKQETDLLFNNPGKYFTDIFYNPYKNGLSHLFSGNESYWSDLKSNIMVKMVSIFNLLSFKNYYINVIFYTFFSFFGPVTLYRLYAKLYPGKTLFLIAGCFLIPSFLYWCSGIHKDGLIFACIAIAMYQMQKMTAEEGFSLKRIVYLAACIILIFPMRNYLSICLLPPITAWFLCHKTKRKPVLVFTIVYAICGILFFTSRFIDPKINLPLSFSMKQSEFLNLKGNSYIDTSPLLPGFKSFVRNLPEAMNHALIRPYPTEIKSLSYAPAAIEVVLLISLVLIYLFKGKKEIGQPAVVFAFFFSMSLLMIIGYLIPFLGAIVRYRSIILPLIATPLLCAVSGILTPKERRYI